MSGGGGGGVVEYVKKKWKPSIQNVALQKECDKNENENQKSLEISWIWKMFEGFEIDLN